MTFSFSVSLFLARAIKHSLWFCLPICISRLLSFPDSSFPHSYKMLLIFYTFLLLFYSLNDPSLSLSFIDSFSHFCILDFFLSYLCLRYYPATSYCCTALLFSLILFYAFLFLPLYSISPFLSICQSLCILHALCLFIFSLAWIHRLQKTIRHSTFSLKRPKLGKRILRWKKDLLFADTEQLNSFDITSMNWTREALVTPSMVKMFTELRSYVKTFSDLIKDSWCFYVLLTLVRL